ncbi:enoyl-CoA hydratase/isomerase family protein [Brevibacillus aydinogluensis]|uniref:Enoyl-CoA hydratase n=1 Tax=Brevibacillus aydinogluensis TaxID=927786 RepID=A0AA48RBS3_9BACL|nr:enoyl-CoA hydratase/isomerase family protein [Brevibacillus aydinogluensis]CAJ1001949.1 hypothetical protein BSPP4475_06475 [Brevibacillus aydinogluensis]
MDTILVEKRVGVACITLNRPHVRNAISLEMAEELRQTVSACEEDDAVKVLVFTGMGDSFISGGDLRQFMQARGRNRRSRFSTAWPGCSARSTTAANRPSR